MCLLLIKVYVYAIPFTIGPDMQIPEHKIVIIVYPSVQTIALG